MTVGYIKSTKTSDILFFHLRPFWAYIHGTIAIIYETDFFLLILTHLQVKFLSALQSLPNSLAARGSNVANPSKVFFSVDSTISECTSGSSGGP